MFTCLLNWTFHVNRNVVIITPFLNALFLILILSFLTQPLLFTATLCLLFPIFLPLITLLLILLLFTETLYSFSLIFLLQSLLFPWSQCLLLFTETLYSFSLILLLQSLLFLWSQCCSLSFCPKPLLLCRRCFLWLVTNIAREGLSGV